jgi:hypothetical protein
MTKNFLIVVVGILTVSSCAFIDYTKLPVVAKDLIVGKENLEITRSIYDAYPYSFAKVRIGRDKSLIFVLSTINANGEYTWISEDYDRLITFDGKVIKFITSNEEINFRYLKNSFSTKNLENFNRENIIELLSPKAIFMQDATINIKDQQTIIRFKESLNVRIIEESIVTKELKWAFNNSYWMNNNTVIKSKQHLHPNLPQVVIEFYYK